MEIFRKITTTINIITMAYFLATTYYSIFQHLFTASFKNQRLLVLSLFNLV